MSAASNLVLLQRLDSSVLLAALTAVKQGDPRERGMDAGQLASQVAVDRLEDQVQRAVEQGATVVAGGKRNGNYFEPTVLTDITPENDIYREELFGLGHRSIAWGRRRRRSRSQTTRRLGSART